MVRFDPDNEFHNRAKARLENEKIGWLTTVGTDGTPQPSPIWFLWDGADEVLIYSYESPRVRNIQANPRVAFSFNSEGGGNVVVFTGTAAVDRSRPPVNQHPAFLAKYAEDLTRINLTPDGFAEGNSAPVVVTLEKLRGH